MKPGDYIIEAAKKQAEGEVAVHLANIKVYQTMPAGIGEHSDLLLEIRKWTDILDNANSSLETLSNDFSVTGDQVQVRNIDQQVARSAL